MTSTGIVVKYSNTMLVSRVFVPYAVERVIKIMGEDAPPMANLKKERLKACPQKPAWSGGMIRNHGSTEAIQFYTIVLLGASPSVISLTKSRSGSNNMT